MKTTATYKENTTAAATTNACKVCSPLGASVAFKGIKGCVPLIHGSQGCSTYIRRYLISHYKEPVDIASSNFSQDTTIFGGHRNFNKGIDNIIRQYKPEVIAIASTCLSETIGEDIKGLIAAYKAQHKDEPLPHFVAVSTPSYQGTHMDGFHEAVASMVAAFAERQFKRSHINLFPGFVSPEDIRHLKEILDAFGIEAIILPDYSESLDNPNWEEYHRIPPGGTSVDDIKKTGSAQASIEFGHILNLGNINNSVNDSKVNPTGAAFLQNNFGIPNMRIGMPIGIKATDLFFEKLEGIAQIKTPEKYTKERGRLIDAYIDGHKYVFGKKAVVYGEEDFVIAMMMFLDEIGIEPVICATGGESGKAQERIRQLTGNSKLTILQGMDFEAIASMSRELKPDIMIGNSKGYYIARELNIPLVRVGFPIHDRMGGQRILHLGYKGTMQLFDSICNALIEYKQNHSPVGYKYM